MKILCGILAGAAVLGITGCTKLFHSLIDQYVGSGKGKTLQGEALDFEEIELRTAGMSAEEEVYRITKTQDGVHLNHYSAYFSWDEEKEEQVENVFPIREMEGDQDTLGYFRELAGGCGIESWDGFSGSNPYVMDGTSFSFYAKLADGRTVSAGGSNRFPAHFWDFYNAVCDFMSSSVIESTLVHGHGFTMTVPESWVNEVSIFYAAEYDCFMMPVESGNAYLLRVDFTKDGYRDGEKGEYIPVCRLVSEKEELYLTFFLYENPGVSRDSMTQKQLAVYDALKEDLPKMIESVEGADGCRIYLD